MCIQCVLILDTYCTKLITSRDQTTASTIHQLRLGHGYFKSFLIRLPAYDSIQCQCSERAQSVKHLLLGCRLYQDERQQAGITRETTLHSLLFTPRGTTILQDFIRMTKVATRRWLLQRADERLGGGEDEWGWGRLREEILWEGRRNRSRGCLLLVFHGPVLSFSFLFSLLFFLSFSCLPVRFLVSPFPLSFLSFPPST